MKNLIAAAVSLIFFISCEGKQKSSKYENIEVPDNHSALEMEHIDSAEAKKILETPVIRYQNSINGYQFSLPFNYRINFVDSGNDSGSYYQFQWKINDKFSIDSNAKGFKRFSVSNFIPYIPSGAGEGDFFVVPDLHSAQLKISDVLKTADETFFTDSNTAIIKLDGRVRAFFFEYLPKSKEYLIYLSNTPFWNKKPQSTSEEELNQLLHQLRMAKNIMKPIGNQNKGWNSYKNQLSILEKDFFNTINTETKSAFSKDTNLKVYAPADLGNFEYYTAFKNNQELEAVWTKLQSAPKNGVISITEADKMFQYLSENNFRFFYNSNYKVIDKNISSAIFKRDSEDSFCLVTQTKDKQFFIFKTFPALTTMSKDYYKNEIEFYKELFENYN